MSDEPAGAEAADGVSAPSAPTAGLGGLAADLEEVCTSATRELGLVGVAVSLRSGKGSEAAAAASDDGTSRLEEMQFDLGEGPGREAFAVGRPVLVAEMDSAFTRWPAYAGAARAAGVEAAYAFPLQVGAACLGAMTFYAGTPDSLDAAGLRRCLVFVERVIDALIGGGVGGKGHRPDVAGVLRFRTEVYQAQGMVMVDVGTDLPDALARMRGHAYANGIALDQLSRDIIAGRTRLGRGDEPDPVPDLR